LYEAGRAVETVWKGLPDRFPMMVLDEFVVMPNHVHGIVIIHGDHDRVGAQFIAPAEEAPGKGAMNRAPTVGIIIRAFKAVSTRWICLGIS
jgi:putative transposase